MKFKLPKYAYVNAQKGKYHLRSNVDNGRTCYGQSYGEDLAVLMKHHRAKIKDIPPERRCLLCFQAFENIEE